MTESKKTPPTILDVARHAGVSVGTVSNVINGSAVVSKKKAQRVEQAIEATGYQRNVLAQRLRRKSSNTIGICIPSSRLDFFSALIDTFQGLCDANGLSLLQMTTSTHPDIELKQIQSIIGYKIDGLIILPSVFPTRSLEYLQATSIPVVAIDRTVEERFGFDVIAVDNVDMVCQFLERVHPMGHRRFLLVARHHDSTVTRRRLEGFKAFSERADSEIAYECMAVGDDPVPFRGMLAEYILRFKPSLILVNNSFLAMWTIKALRELGISCPEEISVAVVDEPVWAEIVQPKMTIIRQSAEHMATEALELLLARLGGSTQEPVRRSVPIEIVVRESVRDLAASSG